MTGRKGEQEETTWGELFSTTALHPIPFALLLGDIEGAPIEGRHFRVMLAMMLEVTLVSIITAHTAQPSQALMQQLHHGAIRHGATRAGAYTASDEGGTGAPRTTRQQMRTVSSTMIHNTMVKKAASTASSR